MSPHQALVVPDYRPVVPPGAPLRVGVLGCGGIAQRAHLPAYDRYGIDVASVWSRNPATTAAVMERYPRIGAVAASAEELLSDPLVDIVDIATPMEVRLEFMAAAVRAGKHVLAQKPLATDVTALNAVLAEADRRGLLVAVNQNGRWAPAWRVATRLVESGAIGDVVGVTHLHDKPLPPLAGTPFDELDHMLITDYLQHWIDITRCWLRGKTARLVTARDGRVPGQPPTARNPWSALVSIEFADGATALLRIAGNVVASHPGCPFWVHGTDGTVRGSILGGSDRVELDRDGATTRYPLTGQWFVDGFAGTMGELMSAVLEGRQPENSARDNLATVGLMLAAQESAQRRGEPAALGGLVL